MIHLHRLGNEADEVLLNPDLILTVEGHPDTVVTLTTGSRMVVGETPDQVVDAIREWRVEVLTGALKRRR